MTLTATFGDELRRAREERGLSQRALGDLIGITGSAVGEWERGESEPTRSKVPVIEDAVGVERGTLAGLLGEEGASIAQRLSDLEGRFDRIEAALEELRRHR